MAKDKPVTKEDIKEDKFQLPLKLNTVNKVDSAFPLGKHIYSHADSGNVGIIDNGTDQYNLFVQTYFNRYYYYISKKDDIRIELDDSPFNMRLFDGNKVMLNGTEFTVKLYRTNL